MFNPTNCNPVFEAKLAVDEKPGVIDSMTKLYVRLLDIECKVNRINTVLFGTVTSDLCSNGEPDCLRTNIHMALERAESITMQLDSIISDLGA